MDNKTRTAVYLRNRTSLTPAQRRRIAKHDHDALATAPRSLRRKAHRQLAADERRRRLSIRTLFTRRAA